MIEIDTTEEIEEEIEWIEIETEGETEEIAEEEIGQEVVKETEIENQRKDRQYLAYQGYLDCRLENKIHDDVQYQFNTFN